MPAPLWLLWLLSEVLIAGAGCHVIDDVDEGPYLETTVVTEAYAAPAPPSYLLKIVVYEDRDGEAGHVLYSDTIEGVGHLTPSHPMPVHMTPRWMRARIEPLGPDENPENNEAWAECSLGGGS